MTIHYWWASQGKNHPVAIAQGTLWSCPTANGTERTDRVLLKKMAAGDTVFHYSKGFLRAVSEVTTEWAPAPRPEGYPARPRESGTGWLVRVTPRATGLSVPSRRIAQILEWGSPGPLTVSGTPHQKFISRLSSHEGRGLLLETGLESPASPADQAAGSDYSQTESFKETDAQTIATIRREQTELRRHLLNGRTVESCAICAEVLPTGLLVAGHIKPRNMCTEEERMDFTAIAMLVCSLGCDALFEHGYIVVDESGRVRRGRPAETKDLERAADLLIGKGCAAHNDSTRANFQAHRILVRPESGTDPRSDDSRDVAVSRN